MNTYKCTVYDEDWDDLVASFTANSHDTGYITEFSYPYSALFLFHLAF